MSGATNLSKLIKKKNNNTKICFVGSHVSALFLEVLNNEDSVDIVLTNEGVYAENLKTDMFDEKSLENVKGIGFDFETLFNITRKNCTTR